MAAPKGGVGSLATGRAPRANAGNRMGKLLAEETEDDFYKTAFGGFEEESGDEEYETENEVEDVVDSDFDADESDEDDHAAGSDSDEPKKKRARHAYKDPKAKKPEGRTRSRAASLRHSTSKETKEVRSVSSGAAAAGTAGGGSACTMSTPTAKNEPSMGRRKSFRLATVEQRREHERRQEESRNKPKKAAKQTQYRKLTQEEILAESEITERENLASLDAYRRLEEEKKKAKVPKPKIVGPVIRFHSVTAPLVDIGVRSSVEVLRDTADKDRPSQVSELNREDHSQAPAAQQRCCRSFVTFTDASSFPRAYFPVPARRMKLHQQPMCCVTGLPAKYKDPLTKMPYATAEAFRMIRAHYMRKQHRHKAVDV